MRACKTTAYDSEIQFGIQRHIRKQTDTITQSTWTYGQMVCQDTHTQKYLHLGVGTIGGCSKAETTKEMKEKMNCLISQTIKVI